MAGPPAYSAHRLENDFRGSSLEPANPPVNPKLRAPRESSWTATSAAHMLAILEPTANACQRNFPRCSRQRRTGKTKTELVTVTYSGKPDVLHCAARMLVSRGNGCTHVDRSLATLFYQNRCPRALSEEMDSCAQHSCAPAQLLPKISWCRQRGRTSDRVDRTQLTGSTIATTAQTNRTDTAGHNPGTLWAYSCRVNHAWSGNESMRSTADTDSSHLRNACGAPGSSCRGCDTGHRAWRTWRG